MTVKWLAHPRAMVELRALTRLLGAWWYPRVFQIAALVALAFIFYFAFTGNPHGENNLATVLTWRVWWALLPLSLLLFGKLWCAICPLAVLSDLTQKFAPLRRVTPRWLREHGAWVMLILFVTLSWAHAIFDIHGTPWLTGVVFIALALGAILLALRYEQRAFCRFVCPVGLMSGLYAMTSPLALRARANVCRVQCANQVCRASAMCKLYEYPRTLDSNRYCVLCGDCIGACPHAAPQMVWRAPTREISEIRKPVFAEAVFAILLLGLVLTEIIRMTPLYPAFMQRALRLTQIDNYALIYTLALAGMLNLLVMFAFLAARIASPNWRGNLARFAYALIPLALGAHLGTNAFEISAEGTRSVQTIINNLNLPLILFDLPPKVRGAIYTMDPAVMTLQYALVALGLLATLVAVRRIARQTQTRALPYTAFALIVAAFYFAVYALPMKPGC